MAVTVVFIYLLFIRFLVLECSVTTQIYTSSAIEAILLVDHGSAKRALLPNGSGGAKPDYRARMVLRASRLINGYCTHFVLYFFGKDNAFW